ncbi:protein Mp1R-MYB12 [Marchantia polymorpha subsp. ruderalis]|uniref:Uncharacterized protein n=2 Tax=Marchantia polymorpha TaxID=3197 RepID=A0AAF6AMF0_MARPO|nr:hypothetical protein MARPO_0043s0095 [Marchantia polymorpha]BBM97620.1 hypothetical protein Mp_1g07040 [Marchantia polymorpha subsp. ruderalis]|eukprot:PTQ39860.1 hypothetical protein MARPO_0043s0095 [Marchantia polymorpha]
MEARSRRVGGGFPGYNGPALPRAMRSSRGRGEAARKATVCGGRAGFFELLATVAGQILQDDSNGEEQDLSNISGVKLKCSELKEKDSESYARISLAKKTLCEPSSIAASCLNSLRAGIRDEEARKHFGLEKEEDESAESAHMVVNRSYVSCSSPETRNQTLLGSDKVVTARSDCVTVSTPEQKVPEGNKQMAVSVSDNDENQTIKSDPESSLSSAIKDASDSDEMHLETREPVERLQIPKIEDLEDGDHLDDRKERKFSIRGNEQLIDMEIDLPKASVMEGSMHYEGHDPVSSTASEATKPEPSSGEVTHLHSCLASREEDALLRDVVRSSKRIIDDTARSPGDKKPWKRTDPCGKEDEGESGVEVDDKSIFETRKPLKVTDVILGRLVAEKVGVERGFVSEQILESSRERILSKDNNNCSSKRNLPENVSQKLKDSYAKGMRARKVVKMVKRSRVSNSRSKRKHAEMEAAADSDEAQGKKAYYRGLSYTRQRTSRGLPAKRKRMADGAPSSSPELHVNTSDLMELGFDCAEGEPPAAAAKLRSDKHNGKGEHVGGIDQARNAFVESACTAKAASVATSPTAKGSAKLSKKSNEPHVKLTIKSFTVPELSVDLPESATVSSLKRAVMDAAMNLLGGGLRVRVLLQGKKVPDEGATLAQVGISRSVKPDSLGFMLEPSPLPTSPTSTSEDPLLVLSRAAGQPSPRFNGFGSPGMPSAAELGSRCPQKTRSNKGTGGPVDGEAYTAPVSGDHNEAKRSGMTFQGPQEDALKGCPVSKPKSGLNERMSLSPHSTRVAAAGALAAIRAQADASRRSAKNESDSATPASHTLAHETMVPGSGAIILHPGMNVGENMQGLALVPVRQKSHSMDVGKRRVRRPFSVSEVEALVHAVEKLGTGRWRDVKLRAFDQAKHRTYVDLKDKWKTLVHTARIAPHQRRGEPVPQELLERVTHAHTYWTAQAAKQQAELDY